MKTIPMNPKKILLSVVAPLLLVGVLAACDNEDVAEVQQANEALASEVTELRNELQTLTDEWTAFQEDQWTPFQEEWNAFNEAEGPFGEGE